MSFFSRSLHLPRQTSSLSTTNRLLSLAPRRTYARITLIGNLGSTPEITTTSTGKEVIRYAVASNTGTRDNQRTSWFRVAYLEPKGNSRDFLAGLDKGTMVHVEADVNVNTYQDETTGKSHTIFNLLQRNLDVLRRPQRNGDGNENVNESSRGMVDEGTRT